MSTQLSFLEKIVEDLIKAKHNNYSQECINFYIDDNLFSIQDIPKLYNNNQEKLKCSFIRHRNYGSNKKGINSKCIIYLHGFGSSRLQALPLIQLLPQEYCICIFDMSGSGKSEGQKITYGLKQQQDIDPIINYLHKKKSIREFVIWGRSMGAVAALLYAINNNKISSKKNKDKKVLSVTQSLKNSIIMPNKNKDNIEQQEDIVIHSLVLDSPFYKFSQVAKQIAQKKLMIPSFLLDIALKYVEQSFGKILSQSIGQKYNPFQINFDKKIKVNIPIVFVYSENDQIICHSHSERLINQMESNYKKVLINPCTHNQTRPQKYINQIFKILGKTINAEKGMDKLSEYCKSKQLSINKSCEKRRGIMVFTQSKQIKRQFSPSFLPKFHQVNVQMIKTQQVGLKSPRYRSNPKKNMITLQLSRQLRKSKDLQTTSTEKYIGIPQLNSVDLQVNRFLNKKLIDSKKQTYGLKMTRANKRHSYDKRKEFQFYNEKISN